MIRIHHTKDVIFEDPPVHNIRIHVNHHNKRRPTSENGKKNPDGQTKNKDQQLYPHWSVLEKELDAVGYKSEAKQQTQDSRHQIKPMVVLWQLFC